jgi:hypothetical protein
MCITSNPAIPTPSPNICQKEILAHVLKEIFPKDINCIIVSNGRIITQGPCVHQEGIVTKIIQQPFFGIPCSRQIMRQSSILIWKQLRHISK